MIGSPAAWVAAGFLGDGSTGQPSLVNDPTPSAGTHVSLVVVLLAVGALLLFAVVYLWRTLGNWKGEADVRGWARDHGWRYTQRNDTLSLNWPEEPFGYAARTTFNVAMGTYRDHRSLLFDIGDRSTTSVLGQLPIDAKNDLQEQLRGHLASAVVMDLPFFIETDLTLRPLRGWSRLWAHDSGRNHIEFENEDFNRLYDVVCTDRDLAYAFLTPRTIDVLLSQPPSEIRVRGTQVLLIDRKPLRIDRMNRWLAMLSALVENVSPYVWTDRGDAVVAEHAVADYPVTDPPVSDRWARAVQDVDARRRADPDR
jgi:hypothetical protein